MPLLPQGNGSREPRYAGTDDHDVKRMVFLHLYLLRDSELDLSPLVAGECQHVSFIVSPRRRPPLLFMLRWLGFASEMSIFLSEVHLGFVYAGPCPFTRDSKGTSIGGRVALRMECTPTPPVHDLLRIRRQGTLGCIIPQNSAPSNICCSESTRRSNLSALAGCSLES
jgi:hypothetical protein